MATRILQSPDFREDTDQAWDYLAAYDVTAADAFVRALAAKLLLLAQFPEMGRARPELRAGLRSVVLDRYVIPFLRNNSGLEKGWLCR